MRAWLIVIVLLAPNLCGATSAEPRTELQVDLAGKTYTMSAGSDIQVFVDGKPQTLRITELPWRHFSEAGIRFDYPRHFPWETDPAPPASWTLDGNSAVIMVFDYGVGTVRSPEEVVDGIENALAVKTHPRRQKAVLLTKAAGALNGIVSTLKLASSTISNEVFVLPRANRSVVLVLQDSLDDHGEHTAEYGEMRERLAATLEF
ncbi:MAG: hypothetical protein ABIR62_01820 [Dokdonella sp.]|uniref:hypothetical protein n=1 Tax=Dokdonella sp. TaxID=2291710 RepID=UPI0032672869